MRYSINFIGIVCIVCFVLPQCQSPDKPHKVIYPDGGYEYPKKVEDLDTNNYFYPVRDVMSTKDSFFFAMYSRYWGQVYNEPNLSIKPLENEVFRLNYGGFKDGEYVITLTETEITVKHSQEEALFPEYDSTKLSVLERFHYETLRAYFPFQNEEYSIPLKKRLDSLAKRHPQLLDFNYYRMLREKSDTFNRKPFEYLTSKIKISLKKYYEIVEQINSSGFWKMPYKSKCPELYADGYGFTLEANTPKKYNIVARSSCASDTSRFRKACQELIKASRAKISVMD